jgi:hypothetical protein
MRSKIGLFVLAFLAGSIAMTGGCSGGDGGGGSGGETCDEATKGFVVCGAVLQCQPGTYCSDPASAQCSDGCTSSANCGCGEVCTGGTCTAESVCGDNKCTGGENSSSCPSDCSSNPCGNGVCDSGETSQNCPEDCSSNPCGNGACDPGETPMTCAVDCSANPCGNGVCEPGESPMTCAVDCPVTLCGNGVCDAGESTMTCPGDCPNLKAECTDNCDDYNFFNCFDPGGLQSCYDACNAAGDAALKQFNNCAATGAVSCDASCFDFL